MKRFRTSSRQAAQRSEAPPRPVYACYHIAGDDPLGLFIMRHFLGEARSEVALGKGRMMFFHRAHAPGGQDHVHFVVKGAKVFAINKDGSAHDRSHGVEMQRWAVDGLNAHHSGFTVPPTISSRRSRRDWTATC